MESITPPPSVSPGLIETIEAAGHTLVRSPEGWSVDNAAAVQAIITSYSSSAAELSYYKARKQAALDALLDNNFDLVAFIRAGTAATLTGTQVGAFLATITNNYRSKRAAIAAAANVAAVQAIDVTSGWPSNS